MIARLIGCAESASILEIFAMVVFLTGVPRDYVINIHFEMLGLCAIRENKK